MKSLTKRQLSFAATLYSLAVTAHADSGGAENEDETRVMILCSERAEARLNNMGYELGDVNSIAQCIEIARTKS